MQASNTLNEMQRFKKFVFELSARLVALPANKIDTEIKKRLRLIGEFWGFDQILLTELSENEKQSISSHSYTSPGSKHPPLTISTDQIPWLIKRLQNGDTVSLSRLPDDLPESAADDRKFCIAEGIRSAIVLPLKVGEFIRGGLFLASLQKARSWDDALIKELQYLAELFSGALERKKSEERIDEILQFEHLLSETSAKYINLPAGEVDQVLKKDLGRLAGLMGANRCIIYMINEDGKSFKPYLNSGWWPEEDNELILSLNPAWSGNGAFLNNFKFLFDTWLKGECLQWNQLDKLPSQGKRMQKAYEKFGLKSQLSIPLSVAGSIMGALTIGDTRFHKRWPEVLIPRLRIFGEVIENALMRKQSEEALRKALMEVSRLKKRIEADYIYLREEIKLEHNFDEIIGRSDVIKSVLFKVEQVAPTDSAVLITGETGTGKELIARAIHNASMRRNRPLVKVNCATLTPSLIESELFGHEKGAFTGAGNRRVGRFELADGATLFLDEIGELPLELQPKLLRVLQDGEFERVGGSQTLRTDVRIIAATNRDLQKEVDEARFRRDLWYRLNTFPILIPPLRERVNDIPVFVNSFVKKYGNKFGKHFDIIPQKMMKELQQYPWPGNVRELENLIERSVITSMDGTLVMEIPKGPESVQKEWKTLQEQEREYILDALIHCHWIVEGPKGAARLLDINASTLRNRMKKLHIKRPRNNSA